MGAVEIIDLRRQRRRFAAQPLGQRDNRRRCPTQSLEAVLARRPRPRALTLKEHRAANRLSTDPRLRFRRKPLLSLDQPVEVGEDGSVASVVRDFVPDRGTPDPSAYTDEEFEDPRIARLWWKFSDR